MVKNKKNKTGIEPKKTKFEYATFFIRAHFSIILFSIIVLLCAFLRFYDINNLTSFGWDQVDSAWASERIIVNHQFPILGTQAKENSGIFVGPIYYYLIAPVYFLTNLDPIASGIFAGITSIFSIITLYFIVRKLFSTEVAIIASFINTVAAAEILFERGQWVVNFIPAVALILFYCLYKIMKGNSKFIIYLAIALGFSFHLHFSSLFYFPIILLTLPFFPKRKKTLKHIGIGAIIFLIFIIPSIIPIVTRAHYSSNALQYGDSYYHGLHLRRVLQIFRDAFIQFEPYLTFNFLKPISVVILPLFILYYLFKSHAKGKFKFIYLMILFFIIPWIALSTYSGEISDYYFSINRFLALSIISYFIYQIYNIRTIIPKVVVVLFLLYYAYFNINAFLHGDQSSSINVYREKALRAVNLGQRIEYGEGVPDSYFYFYYMYKKGQKVY